MIKAKSFLYYPLIAVIFIAIGWSANTAYGLYSQNKQSHPPGVIVTPLDKYTIENLTTSDVQTNNIKLGNVLRDDPNFTSYEYSMSFSPDFSKNFKTTSGMVNIPKKEGPYPLVVMFRGYVDPTKYFIGEGTQPAASVFAKEGYMTVSPDFLGYGDSDHEAGDVFESRFQTYVAAMATIKAVKNLKNWDGKNIFIWGHSNGGQITLTTLEVTGVNYPTVLWAPVSKPFPYSILYYTDDADDHGKFLRKELADFEQTYDVEKYSLTNYLSQIKAPIQLNQGTADKSVPPAWSDLLSKELKEATVSAAYVKYPGNDHNMRPNWNEAVNSDLNFYKKYLQ